MLGLQNLDRISVFHGRIVPFTNLQVGQEANEEHFEIWAFWQGGFFFVDPHFLTVTCA